MSEMLNAAAGDLAGHTGNKLDFYVVSVGVADPATGPVNRIRYNCYIRVLKSETAHLFFQVTTPSGSAFEAEIGTPEGERYARIKDEDDLRKVIGEILSRPRTAEVIAYLLRLA